MKSTAREISKTSSLMREAERTGFASQVKSLARENQHETSKEKGFEMER
jgi:hypothetical protein